MPDGSKPVSILSPLSYYYNNRWYFYRTFENLVYTQSKKGTEIPLFRWDFGKYNDEEGNLPAFPYTLRCGQQRFSGSGWRRIVILH